MRLFVIAMIICTAALAAGTVFYEVDKWFYGPLLINDEFMQRASKLQGSELTPQVIGVNAAIVVFKDPKVNIDTFVSKTQDGKYYVMINNGLYKSRHLILNNREVNSLIDSLYFRDPMTRVKDKQKIASIVAKIPKSDNLFKAQKYVRKVARCGVLPWDNYTSRETRYKLVQMEHQDGYPPTLGAKVQGKTLRLEGIPGDPISSTSSLKKVSRN